MEGILIGIYKFKQNVHDVQVQVDCAPDPGTSK